MAATRTTVAQVAGTEEALMSTATRVTTKITRATTEKENAIAIAK
jgi:hypothetical protein